MLLQEARNPDAAPADNVGATSSVSDRAVTAAGCEPSEIGPLPDEDFTTPRRQFGSNDGRLGDAGAVVASLQDVPIASYPQVKPHAAPGGRGLKLILWLPQAQQLGLVYSTTAVSADTPNIDLFKGHGIALTQRPFSGMDARFVYDGAPRNKWLTQVSQYEAVLLWPDPMAEGVRPFRLYWADGIREWILIGNTGQPDELVDFARSIYC